ncbi:MAG TPA: Fe-S protein assembly co-chaperone HscB [Clostridia bacterium]|nr:Fe-S protein assembly co-chaperone HscB [Clostridia bacterium]
MSDRIAISVEGNGADATAQCWSCGAMRAAHFCDSCGHVQPPIPTDFFSFFGLPRKLNIDLNQLERSFYALSRKLHPDIYARSAEDEQHWSMEKTSQLNDAYRTLRDPISRTEYLLKLEGVRMEEQSKTATELARIEGGTKKQVLPPDLLEEVFELNMQLEEARTNKKMGEADPQLAVDLQRTKKHLEEKYSALDVELHGYWNQWDALVAGQEAGKSVSAEERKQIRDRMVDLLNRRSYIRNLVRDVSEVLES